MSVYTYLSKLDQSIQSIALGNSNYMGLCMLLCSYAKVKNLDINTGKIDTVCTSYRISPMNYGGKLDISL